MHAIKTESTTASGHSDDDGPWDVAHRATQGHHWSLAETTERPLRVTTSRASARAPSTKPSSLPSSPGPGMLRREFCSGLLTWHPELFVALSFHFGRLLQYMERWAICLSWQKLNIQCHGSSARHPPGGNAGLYTCRHSSESREYE